MLPYICFALLSLTLFAQTNSDTATMVSLVPPYPANGWIGLDLQKYVVFLKSPDQYLLSYSATIDPSRIAQKNGRIEFPIAFSWQISPGVDVTVKQLENGEYLYSYSVRNLKPDRVVLSSVRLQTRSIEAVEGVSSVVNSPGWRFDRMRDPNRHVGPVWQADLPVSPANNSLNFSFRSSAKPEIMEMSLSGIPGRAWEGSLPESIQAGIDSVMNQFPSSVAVLTVGPKYPPDIKHFAIAADLLAQIEQSTISQFTSFSLELRSNLRDYVKRAAPLERSLEDISEIPNLRNLTRPSSYLDGLYKTVLSVNLGLN